jgi:hypothetical protein
VTPLYGFLEGDTVGLLILAGEHETVGELAGKLQSAAAVRVAPRPRVRVLHDGRALDPQLTVAAAGLRPLDRFDVVEER